MRSHTSFFFLMVSISVTLLTSCASSSGALKELISQQKIIEKSCIEQWESSKYDPVRGKLALSPHTHELVALQLNRSYPSQEEQPLIAEFASLLYTCRSTMGQLSSALSPDVGARTIQQAQAELGELIKLHDRKITFGEFNSRRAQIAANRHATETQLDREAWERLIEAERQRSSDFWRAYVRGREEMLREFQKNRANVTRCRPGIGAEVVCTTSSTGY